MTPQFANAECPECGAGFKVDRDEDGFADIPEAVKCEDPGCETTLCPECPQLRCDACGLRFCARHAVITMDGLKLCGACALDVPVLDYQDGGGLLCGVCRKTCMRHYRLHGNIDVGECCAFDPGQEAA
jgi:predicted Zn finger-like uncharacterized protein